MLLRHRLALLIAVTLIAASSASLVLTDIVYGRIQERESADSIERELERTANVVRSGALGQDLIAPSETLSMQFVAADGRVELPVAGADPLPLHIEPTVVRGNAGSFLVTSAPWVLPSGAEIGTIRVALDLGEAEAARASLRRGLVITSVLVVVIALLGALTALRRSLAPLLGLANEAANVDPAEPRLASYRGPADEVAAVAGALNRALEGIRERQRAERDALAEVAHELAAPLTVVAGKLRSLEAAVSSDERVTAARRAADELLHTSQDLLTLARGELEVVPNLEVVDLSEVAEQIAAECPGVRTVAAGGDVRVLADTERVRQVVRNVVRNAVQASPAGKVVVVRTSADDTTVGLEVMDHAVWACPRRSSSGCSSATSQVGLVAVPGSG